ncbi:MAG: hypothetical protein WD226_05765 [Planctomycetota bacterium]
MKEPADDPLERLREAWRSASEQNAAPLPPAFESGSLEDEDPLTRAAVEWLRAAHAARRAPEPELPLRLRRPARRRPSPALARRVRWAAALASAAVIAAGVCASFVEWPARTAHVADSGTNSGAHETVSRHPRAGRRGSADVADPTDSNPIVPKADASSPPSSTVDVALAERARVRDIPPDRFHLRDDGIELVSGRVRLVLLDR